jgi:hypothetical protein
MQLTAWKTGTDERIILKFILQKYTVSIKKKKKAVP